MKSPLPAAADLTSPYLANREKHNDRYMNLATGKRNWQLCAGGLLLATIISNVGTVYVSQQQKIVPYVVGPATTGSDAVVRELIPTSVLHPDVISVQLADFILKIRRLSTDATLMKQDSEKAFAMCLAPAENYIRGYYKDVPTAETLRHNTVSPQNIRVVPRPGGKTWEADWYEEQIDLEGHRLGAKKWEATIEIVLIMPTNLSERTASPLGLWVERISWSERS